MNPHSTLSVSDRLSPRLPGDYGDAPAGRHIRYAKLAPVAAFFATVFCSVAAAAAVVVNVPLTVMGLWS